MSNEPVHAAVEKRTPAPTDLLTAMVEAVYPDVPGDFKPRLLKELRAIGIEEPADALGPGGLVKLKAALHAAVRGDVFDILRVAREVANGEDR